MSKKGASAVEKFDSMMNYYDPTPPDYGELPPIESYQDEVITDYDLGLSNGRAKAKLDRGKVELANDFDLRNYGLDSADRDHMREKMLHDKYIMHGIALLGQITVIFAKPNTGKTLLTLWMLVESASTGIIEGNNILYINADDTYRGLLEKSELVAPHGIIMLAPGVKGFKAADLLIYLEAHIKKDTARGLIIVLDTVKKFIDTMDKKASSGFMAKLREFVTAGGSVILLGHANKHRSAEGKLVAGGTSDIPDDVDCSFFLDDAEASSGQKQIIFENMKARGDMVSLMAFQHARMGQYNGYGELFASVSRLSPVESKEANIAVRKAEFIEANASIIDSIVEAITAGHVRKCDIVTYVHSETYASKPKINNVIDNLEGSYYAQGHRWRQIKGEKNAKEYRLLGETSELAYMVQRGK